MTHKCPVAGCSIDVVNSKLMCSRHWALVSADTAREVYAAYKAGPRAKRHADAMRAAIDEAEGRRAKKKGELI